MRLEIIGGYGMFFPKTRRLSYRALAPTQPRLKSLETNAMRSAPHWEQKCRPEGGTAAN